MLIVLLNTFIVPVIFGELILHFKVDDGSDVSLPLNICGGLFWTVSQLLHTGDNKILRNNEHKHFGI